MGKIKGAIKTKIVKLFKKGVVVPDIKLVVMEEFPKITLPRIRTVIKQHLVKLCDELWSRAVKLRDGNRCIVSGKTGNLNSHHLIGRGNNRYRWILENGVTLSPDHHTLGHDLAAHGSTDVTERFAEWMSYNRPEQWEWFKLCRDNKRLNEVEIYGLLGIAKRLQGEIENLNSSRKPDILARKKAAMVPQERKD